MPRGRRSKRGNNSIAAANNLVSASQQGDAVSLPARDNSGRASQQTNAVLAAAANNLGGASQQGGAVSLPARDNSGRASQQTNAVSAAAANNLGGASQQGGAVSLPARNNSGRAPHLRGTASLPAASSSALTIPTHTSTRGIVKAGSGKGTKNNLSDAVKAIIQSGNVDAIKTNLSLLERSIGNRKREQQLPEYRRNANTKAAQNHERWTNIERTQRDNLQAALDSFSPNLIIRATTTSAVAASSSFQPRAGGGASAQLPPPPDWSKLNFKKKNQDGGK